ncbi:MAG: hypothetical protein R6V60_06305 [Desulfobacterales bacterium]
MQTVPMPIAPLCKISLELKITGAGRTSQVRPFTFIAGIASGGLSPFEYALLEKKVGDRVTVEIDPQSVAATFEHLQPPLTEMWDEAGPATLEARVIAVAQADSREIIKAMAAATGGCGDGQCSCGCGGH